MTAKTVLFAWELGEGLGHVAPLVAICDALQELMTDIRPVFVFCDPVFGRIGLGERGFPVLPAPLPQVVSDIRSRSASYAEFLTAYGYGDPEHLGLALRAWDDVFSLLDPDLVVADHSPTACLAARGRVPVLVTGNGFTVPPSDIPSYPPLQTEAQSLRNQTRLLDTVNAVLSLRGVPLLERLPELLRGEARAIFALPQLDPYQKFRTERVLGPYAGIRGPLEPPGSPAIFLYSRSEQRGIEDIANALWQSGLPVSCFVRGGRTVGTAFLKQMGHKVHETAPPLSEAFAEASIVVSHGGGISQAALQAGRPQVLIPNHLEAMITARRVEALGAGLTVESREFENLPEAVTRVHADSKFEINAIAQARAIAAMELPEKPAMVAAEMCGSLLGGRGAP